MNFTTLSLALLFLGTITHINIASGQHNLLNKVNNSIGSSQPCVNKAVKETVALAYPINSNSSFQVQPSLYIVAKMDRVHNVHAEVNDTDFATGELQKKKKTLPKQIKVPTKKKEKRNIEESKKLIEESKKLIKESQKLKDKTIGKKNKVKEKKSTQAPNKENAIKESNKKKKKALKPKLNRGIDRKKPSKIKVVYAAIKRKPLHYILSPPTHKEILADTKTKMIQAWIFKQDSPITQYKSDDSDDETQSSYYCKLLKKKSFDAWIFKTDAGSVDPRLVGCSS